MTDNLPAGIAGAVDLSSLGQPPATSGAASQSQVVIEVTEAEFQQVVELSARVPVILDLGSPRQPQSAEFSAVLAEAVEGYTGRLVLARIDIEQAPQLQQALQVQAVPTVVALIGGRPAPLFAGAQQREQLTEIFDQVLQIAQQQGVAGSVPVDGGDAAANEEEKPLPPLHQEAFDALQTGDLDAAAAAYEKALKEQPSDADASAGLAQGRLMQRLQGATMDEIRSQAAATPEDLDKQMLVADLDVSGGHIDDAFGRLLDLFPTAGERKDQVRTRLLELFEVVGQDDPRVNAARKRLMLLLY